MLASRFVATFREEVQTWNKKLNAVADVVQLMAEIQRSWACEDGWPCKQRLTWQCPLHFSKA
jgi:hypothetical protein